MNPVIPAKKLSFCDDGLEVFARQGRPPMSCGIRGTRQHLRTEGLTNSQVL